MPDSSSEPLREPSLITRLALGDFEIFSLTENRCYLDGGSMYGVVPKALWSKLTAPDDNNLIPLDTNLLFLRAHGRRILIECGIGDLLTELERKIYSCNSKTNIENCLLRLGLKPDMIDCVILTHLHLDHVGGAFVAGSDGRPRPRFPNARHFIRKEEWEAAMNPDDRSSPVYPTERLRCIEEAGLADLIETDTEIVPGIWAVKSGGHTRGHQIITMSSGARTVVYAGDMFPLTSHLRPTYIAASDLFPLETLEHKKATLSKIIDENWIIAFDHDLEYKFATLRKQGKAFVPEKVGEPFLAVLRSCQDNINESREATG